MRLFALTQPAYDSRLIALLVSGSLLMACSDHRSTARDSEWQSVLARFEHATALFSLAYSGAPPEGTELRVALHEEGASAACNAYQAESQSDLPDFWFMALTLNHPDRGEYLIDPDYPAPGSKQQASVRLSHVVDGKKVSSYYASNGSVTLSDSPRDVAEWQSGANLEGSLDVGFPSLAIHQVECRGERNLQTGEGSYECTCADDAGNLSTCATGDGHDCCVSRGPLLALHADLQASQCPWMCVGSDASLYRHCLELQE